MTRGSVNSYRGIYLDFSSISLSKSFKRNFRISLSDAIDFFLTSDLKKLSFRPSEEVTESEKNNWMISNKGFKSSSSSSVARSWREAPKKQKKAKRRRTRMNANNVSSRRDLLNHKDTLRINCFLLFPKMALSRTFLLCCLPSPPI